MRALALFLMLAAGAALAQENKVVLKDAPGRDKAMQCLACHSLDYLQMNSRFLDKAGWTASVNKMIGWGAEVPEARKAELVAYLVANFGPDNTKFQPVVTRPVGR